MNMDVKRFRFADVRQAPKGPGLYVWYAHPILGQADTDSETSFEAVLVKQTDLCTNPQMEISANYHFAQRWRGAIETEGPRRPLTEVAQNRDSRRAVAALLERAQHLFYRPLYIGKAEKGLRRRLGDHSGEFLRLYERKARGPSPAGDTFAQRAVKLGFSADELVCYTLELHESTEDKGDVLAVAEHYLNTWATPILGRK